MKKLGLLIGTILLFGVGLIGCKNNENDKIVKIGFPGTQRFLPGVAGVAQGNEYIEQELEKVGYKVEYKPFSLAGPAVNEALASNEIDIAIYADFPGILSKANGIDTKLIGIYDNRISSALIAKLDSNINSVKELKGKKIGFTKGTYMHKYLYQILELNGLSQTDVELINMADGDSVLQGGTIDALATTEGGEALSVITKMEAKTIDTSLSHPDITAQGIIVGNKIYVESNSEAIVAVQKALIRAREYMREEVDEAYKILSKSGYNEEAIKKIYGKDNNKFDYITLEINDESIKKLEESKRFMIDNKLISDDFDINTWIDNSFYEKALNQ